MLSVFAAFIATLVPLTALTVAAAEQAAATSPAWRAASFSGRVVLSGGHEGAPPLKVFKNRNFCGDTVHNETLLVSPDGGVGNAVVTLRPLDRVVTAPPGRVVLDNQRCAFVPHVQVAILGSDLLLKNSDPILHAVHARLGKETLFNVGLPTWRQVTKRLDREGVIRIDCDVLHTWMSAVIVVVKAPYYSVADANGNFSLEGVPPGSYEMRVWHETLGVKTSLVSLAENTSIYADIFFSAKKVSRW